MDICPRCTDTSEPRHFGPKTVRHYIFGTEMAHFFVSVPKCLWDTSAPVPKCLNILWRGRTVQDISALVPLKCLGQIGGAFIFLYRFIATSCHICTIHRDLLTASRDILYIRNHNRTFTFDSLTLLRPREQFRWWWWWWSSSSVSLKNSAEN